MKNNNSAGKGSWPARNVGARFKENFDTIDWRKKPEMVVGNLYLYKDKSYRYLGKTDVQGCEYHQFAILPDEESGIYLNDDEIKDLKEIEPPKKP